MVRVAIKRSKRSDRSGGQRNQSADHNIIGASQPANPREKYSSGVKLSPRMFLSADEVRIFPKSRINSVTDMSSQ